MKKLFLSTVWICLSLFSYAQDIITKKDGSDIKAIILEITQNEVKYKKANYLDGPILSINKADVLLITYANGVNEIINAGQDGQPAGNVNSTAFSLDMLNPAEGLSVLSGDASILRKPAKIFIQNINYDSCIIEGKPIDEWLAQKGDDFVRDWPNDQVRIKEYYVDKMAKRCKTLSLAPNEASAEYVMKTYILKMVPGHYTPVIPAQRAAAARLWGVIEISSGAETKLVLSINELRGYTTSASMVSRFQIAFEELARYLAKMCK